MSAVPGPEVIKDRSEVPQQLPHLLFPFVLLTSYPLQGRRSGQGPPGGHHGDVVPAGDGGDVVALRTDLSFLQHHLKIIHNKGQSRLGWKLGYIHQTEQAPVLKRKTISAFSF